MDVTYTGVVPFNCTYFQEYRDAGVISNDYSCNGTVSPSPLPPGGLSTGAKAGIGVGAGLGGIIVIGCTAAAIIYCCKPRHRKPAPTKGPGTTVNGDASVAEETTGEVEGKEIEGEESPPELHGRETDAVRYYPEMEGEQARVLELDGGKGAFNNSVSAELESRTFPVEMPP